MKLNVFEDWFREKFSNVSIRLFRRTNEFAPYAFTKQSQIFLSDSLVRCNSLLLTSILIHEFAHIVQKKRGEAGYDNEIPVDRSVDLEQEADAAALAFICGERCPALSPDSTQMARRWGPAGHFYTVYWIARTAGMSDSSAEMLAFFAQMPDQVIDLDAATAGAVFFASLPFPRPIRKTLFRGEDRFDQYVYAIQAGLHCLNGRASDPESERRAKILRRLPDDRYLMLSFGLGVHALGDSYAHRKNNGQNFLAPLGHGLAGDTPQEVLLKFGTEIDNLSAHHDHYWSYCLSLFDLISERFCKHVTSDERRSQMPTLYKNIGKVSEQPEKEGQIAALTSFNRDRRGFYAPEGEPCQAWHDFNLRHASTTALWMHSKAQELAAAWTVSPG